jgi:hypothetical protein
VGWSADEQPSPAQSHGSRASPSFLPLTTGSSSRASSRASGSAFPLFSVADWWGRLVSALFFLRFVTEADSITDGIRFPPFQSLTASRVCL